MVVWLTLALSSDARAASTELASAARRKYNEPMFPRMETQE
jgi:hypothetical protein